MIPTKFSQEKPVQLPEGDFWVCSLPGDAATHQIEVRPAKQYDGAEYEWEASPYPSTGRYMILPGGMEVRPATAGVELTAHLAR